MLWGIVTTVNNLESRTLEIFGNSRQPRILAELELAG